MQNKPYIALAISIISVSFAAIFIYYLDSLGAPALTIAFYRLLFTTLLIAPFVFVHKKTRIELLNLPQRHVVIMGVIGLILAAHFALWITSLTKTSIASSVILVTAHPILVAPLAYYFLKERLSAVNITGILLSVGGVIILVYGNYGLPSYVLDSVEGNILAMLGGAAAGLYILGGRVMRKTISIATYAFVVYATGTVALFFVCLLFNAPLLQFSIDVYALTLLMAVVAGIFGHTLYNWSLRYVRASLASVVLLGEPIGSSILAYVLPGIQQIPSQYTLIGGSIILLGIYLTSRKVYERTTLKT
jgi:drug/metabolite transporter (DMT)-like permease